MIKQGCFPQLQQIFEVINEANPPPEDPNTLQEESSDDDDDRLKSLQGVRGEAKVVMLDEYILTAIERERNAIVNGNNGRGKVPKPIEIDDNEYLKQQQQQLSGDLSKNDFDEEPKTVHRQTFVYSATLTLPPSTHHLIKQHAAISNKSSGRKKEKKQPTTVDDAIAEILKIAGARGETKIVDLSNLVSQSTNQQSRKGIKNRDSGEGKVSSNKIGNSINEPSKIASCLPL